MMEEEIKKDIAKEEEALAAAESEAEESEAAEAEESEAEESEAAEAEAVEAETEESGAAETEAEESGTGEADAEDASRSTGAAKKEGLFKKKKDKRDEQIEELQDRLKRQMAEFENFRKRSEKEKSQMFDLGARSLIEKFLPVIDNFERGLAAVPEEQKEDAFVTGMDKVYKQLLTELENAGVKQIEAVGQEFNPDFHNAVMQVESGELESGMVAQELQKGYTYKDTVVRHSMVSVVS